MVRFCIVPNCNNSDHTTLCHRFPKNQKLRADWIKNLNLIDDAYTNINKYVVCTLHFDITDYRHINSNCLNWTACPKLNGITPRLGVIYNNSSRKRPKINSVFHMQGIHVSKLLDEHGEENINENCNENGNDFVYNNVDSDGSNSSGNINSTNKECHYFLYDDLNKIGRRKRKLIKETRDEDYHGNIANNKDIDVDDVEIIDVDDDDDDDNDDDDDDDDGGDNNHNEFDDFNINYEDEDLISRNINLMNGKVKNSNTENDADTSFRYSLMQDDDDDNNEEITFVPKEMENAEENYLESSNDNNSDNCSDYDDNEKEALSCKNVLNFINDNRIMVSIEQQQQEEDKDMMMNNDKEVKEDEEENIEIIEFTDMKKNDNVYYGQNENEYHDIVTESDSNSDKNEKDIVDGDTHHYKSISSSTFSINNVKQFNRIKERNYDQDDVENDDQDDVENDDQDGTENDDQDDVENDDQDDTENDDQDDVENDDQDDVENDDQDEVENNYQDENKHVDDDDTLDDEYSNLTKSQLIKLLKQSKQKITGLECKIHKMENAHKQLMDSFKNFQSLL